MKIIRREYCVVEPQEGVFLIERTTYLFGWKFWISVLGQSPLAERGQECGESILSDERDEETSFTTMNCALDYIAELKLKND